MGFFDDVGETLFGTRTKAAGQRQAKKAAEATAAANAKAAALSKNIGGMSPGIDALQKKNAEIGKGAAAIGAQAVTDTALARKQGAAYDAGTAQSMGANAGEYMKNAQASASAGAEQAGQTAATQGTRAALRGARSSGLSKGQAALMASQGAGDIYSGVYQGGLESGKNAYMQGTAQMAGQGAEMANRQATGMGQQLGANQAQLGAASGEQGAMNTKLGMYGAQNNALNTQMGGAGQQAQMAQNQTQNAANTSASTWGTIGTLAGAGAVLSDENAKTNIMTLGSAQDTTKGDNAKGNAGLMRGAAALKKTINPGEATAEVGKGAKALSALSTLSDERSKTRVSDIRDSLSKVTPESIRKEVRPVTFEYKEGMERVEPAAKAGVQHLGVIAQDLEKTGLAPAVETGDDGYKRINTAELAPALLNLFIQQSKQVADMAAEIKTLKGGK